MIISRNIKNKMYRIDISNDKLNELEFLELDNIIRNIENQEDDWLSVSYKNIREDKIGCIQTNLYDDEYYNVEVIHYHNNLNNYNIYSFLTNNIEEVIEMFKYVLIDYKCPIDIKTQIINNRCIQQIIPKDNNHEWKDVSCVVEYLLY